MVPLLRYRTNNATTFSYTGVTQLALSAMFPILQVTPVLCHYKQAVYALLQDSDVHAPGNMGLGTERKQQGAGEEGGREGSTPLP